MAFHKVPHLQRTANKHRIFKSDSCLAESEETRSQYHWCQCCCWCLLAWMTRLEIGVNNSSSFTLFPLSACFSQHDFSMSPGEMGFLTIPLPEPMTILMIDHSPLDCGERKGSRPQCKIKKKKKKRRGRKEGRGQFHKVRVMSSLLFSVVRSVACAAARGQGE